MARRGKAGQAYQEIERLIVSEQLPPGTLVSEAMLMERTGLGRTPVREALQQLARNRMVEVYPNRGVLIPPASVESQLRMLEVRRALETLAVRLACHNAKPDQREQMKALKKRLTGEALAKPDYAETLKEFHELIAHAAGNEYLADAMAPLQGLSRRFWLAHLREESNEIQRGAAYCHAILRAILARDVTGAERSSLALNDYLVEFAYSVLRHPPIAVNAEANFTPTHTVESAARTQ